MEQIYTIQHNDSIRNKHAKSNDAYKPAKRKPLLHIIGRQKSRRELLELGSEQSTQLVSVDQGGMVGMEDVVKQAVDMYHARGKSSSVDQGGGENGDGKPGVDPEAKSTEWKPVLKILKNNVTAVKIFKAVKSGNYIQVDQLLTSSSNVSRHLTSRDSDGNQVIHVAAKMGFLEILKLLVTSGADINAGDCEGNRALHLAIMAGHLACVQYLVQADADRSLQNDLNNAPVHVAVDLNKIDMLKALLSVPGLDVNQKGIRGARPLHYAAWSNHAECALLLLENGGCPCLPCDLGFSAVHTAAHYASSDTLIALMNHAEKIGIKSENVLGKSDIYSTLPIHSAVSGGNVEAVKTCLTFGAKINTRQEDNSTPVHLAAANGSVELLRVMFEYQPGLRQETLKQTDSHGMTPLHRAAMFERDACVQLLIDEGSDINLRDSDGMSPVLVAASNGSWNSVAVLLKAGASILERDNKNRNLLHLVISIGGRTDQFRDYVCHSEVMELSNEADDWGCTPLHYASRQGSLSTVNSLIKMGAQISARTNTKESPLHFAAKYGRYNTCVRLLDNTTGPGIINEGNSQGRTALHLAAANGQTRVVKLLLQHGALPMRDVSGNSAVHCAAAEGHSQTMDTILNIHGFLMDAQDKQGNTPLHIAAMEGNTCTVSRLLDRGADIKYNANGCTFFDIAVKNGQKDVLIGALASDRWQQVLRTKSKVYHCPVIALVRYQPDVLMIVLNKCVIPSPCDPGSADFYYTYNFEFLEYGNDTVQQLRADKKTFQPLVTMNMMVQYNRVDCLSHPLCTAYLEYKWQSYGVWFHMINLFNYVVFLIALTVSITTYEPLPLAAHNNHTQETLPSGFVIDINYYDRAPNDSLLRIVMTYFLLFFCFANAIKEVVQMIQQRGKYFKDIDNVLEWVLYVTTALFITPFIFSQSSSWQWQCGAIAVFLAWFNLLLFMQRFDVFGIYVVMFIEILKTVLRVLCVFSFMIVAFALAFYILLGKEESQEFESIGLSLMTVVVMMLTNIQYMTTWVDPATDDNDATLHFPTLSFIVLAIFVLLMPILLMNLLIGLAVGDITSVQKNARLKRLAKQVELHTSLERKLPHRWMDYLRKDEIQVYPNRCCSYSQKYGKGVLGWNGVTSVRYKKSPDLEVLQEAPHVYMQRELASQKQRVKKLTNTLDKQTDMLRLIIQKMEIIDEDYADSDESDVEEDVMMKKRDVSSASVKIRPALQQRGSLSSE